MINFREKPKAIINQEKKYTEQNLLVSKTN